MRGYAGVIVFFGESVLLIQEPDFFTGEPRWDFPSGKIEDGEAPIVAAARELAEESGTIIDTTELDLIATADVKYQGQQLSRSWNFTTVTSNAHLEPADPDQLVLDAQWFERAEAIDLLGLFPYAPKREPALRFLKSGDRGLHWTFDVVDPNASTPSFGWDPPESGHPSDGHLRTT